MYTMKEMSDLLTEDHGRIPRGYSEQCLNQSYMFDGKYNDLLLPIGNKFVQLWRFHPDVIGRCAGGKDIKIGLSRNK